MDLPLLLRLVAFFMSMFNSKFLVAMYEYELKVYSYMRGLEGMVNETRLE
jgi:hypothetical protein